MLNRRRLEREELMRTVRAALESHLPWVLQLEDRGTEVGHSKAQVTNGDSQIRSGESPKPAVQAVSNTHALRGGVAQDHHLAFSEVNFEARQMLKAKQEKFDIRDLSL